MYERNSPPAPHLPNKLSEFVVNGTPTYERLRAPTLEEGNDAFIAVLTELLKTSRLKEPIGGGYFNTVYGLEDEDGIVIKQLYTDIYTGGKSLSELWQRIQSDHHVISAYLGNKFVPDTEFLVLNHHFDASPTIYSPSDTGQEYVAVQERAVGETFYDFSYYHRQPSPRLKQDAIEYIKCCERMMRAGLSLDHPNDLMIDDSPNATRRITLLDTNNLAPFTGVVAGSELFLKEYNIDPASIQTPEDLLSLLYNIVPDILSMGEHEAKRFRAQSYLNVVGQLKNMEELSLRLHDALQRPPRNLQDLPAELRNNRFLDQLLFSRFNVLVSYAERFAPEGQYPQIFLDIMKVFEVTASDLR